jgi:hypothetical protein
MLDVVEHPPKSGHAKATASALDQIFDGFAAANWDTKVPRRAAFNLTKSP